jgi:hypothetical protein
MRAFVLKCVLLAALAASIHGYDIGPVAPVPKAGLPFMDFADNQWKGTWGWDRIEIHKGQCKGFQGWRVLRGEKYVIEVKELRIHPFSMQFVVEKGNRCQVIKTRPNTNPLYATTVELGIYRWEPPGRLKLCILPAPHRPKVFPGEDERGLPTGPGQVCILDLVR